MESAADFRTRLIGQAGLSASVVDAAWPDWWTDEAAASMSAHTELRFSVARKLGLDPRTLIDDQVPGWIWEDAARFKSFRGDVNAHQPAISSFGMALGRMLLQASPAQAIGLAADGSTTAESLRHSLLRAVPVIGLLDLLMLSWASGIPVVHLRMYPLSAKKMSAMSVRIGDRFVILLARDARYPAPSAFHLAHELGHILLGHLAPGQSIVDLGGFGDPDDDEPDDEERQADVFALELLTGERELGFRIEGDGRSARGLATQALRVERERRIEAGTVALAYGHHTQHWDTAMGALRYIYPEPHDVWDAVNRIALHHLRWDEVSDESESYVRAIMGGLDG